jgi:hypothetical protein
MLMASSPWNLPLDDVFGNKDAGLHYQITILKSQIESKNQTLKNPEKFYSANDCFND